MVNWVMVYYGLLWMVKVLLFICHDLAISAMFIYYNYTILAVMGIGIHIQYLAVF